MTPRPRSSLKNLKAWRATLEGSISWLSRSFQDEFGMLGMLRMLQEFPGGSSQSRNFKIHRNKGCKGCKGFRPGRRVSVDASGMISPDLWNVFVTQIVMIHQLQMTNNDSNTYSWHGWYVLYLAKWCSIHMHSWRSWSFMIIHDMSWHVLWKWNRGDRASICFCASAAAACFAWASRDAATLASLQHATNSCFQFQLENSLSFSSVPVSYLCRLK